MSSISSSSIKHGGDEALLGGAGGLLKLSPDQESALDNHFSRNKNMHPSDVAILSAETGLAEEQVQQWFYHRLASWRKEQGLGPLMAGRLYE